LRNLSKRELGHAWRRHCFDRVDEDGRGKSDRRIPELVQGNLAKVGALDIGGNDKAGRAKLRDGIFSLPRGRGRIRQGHRCKQCEFRRVPAAQLRETLVEEPMPARGNRRRQPIGENVRPDRKHLAGHTLRRHAGQPLLDRLDQLGKEGTDFQAVIEMQGALRRCLDQRDSKLTRAILQRVDQPMRNVMRMHVDRHSASSCSTFSDRSIAQPEAPRQGRCKDHYE